MSPALHPLLGAVLARRAVDLAFPHGGILGQSAQAKAAKRNASIGIALLDDGEPMHLSGIRELVHLRPREIFPYASSFGLPALRSQWAEHISSTHPSCARFPRSTPLVAAGITHALAIAAHLFADADHPVALPQPGWDNYRLIFGSASGATLAGYDVFDGSGAFDAGMLDAFLQEHSSGCIVLNFPLNPTGTVPTPAQAEALVQSLCLAAERGGTYVVLVDDAYAGFVFDKHAEQESLFGRLGNAHPNILAIKADGSSKEDFAWGLRVAFLTFASPGLGPDDLRLLEDKAAAVVRATVSNACLLSQELLLRTHRHPEAAEQRASLREILKRRFHLAMQEAARSEYATSFTSLPCHGGYFLCIRPNSVDAEKVRETLLQDEGVGLIAMDGLLRVAFSSLSEPHIAPVFTAIHHVCQRLSSTVL